jgi:hypothetical protein
MTSLKVITGKSFYEQTDRRTEGHSKVNI